MDIQRKENPRREVKRFESLIVKAIRWEMQYKEESQYETLGENYHSWAGEKRNANKRDCKESGRRRAKTQSASKARGEF